MNVIEAAAVTKVFGDGDVQVSALRGVSLQVPQGEFLAVMGPSGSGKSTFLHILGGIEVPSSGQIRLEGTDLATLGDDERTLIRRRRIGFIFQTFNLLPTLSAEENVALPVLLDGVSSRDAHERARQQLERVGMSHRRTHLPSQLSGGEQQRVAIARALVINPAFLLADEPTGNLDSANGKQIIRILRSCVDEHGQTIVVVTHDPAVADCADRTIHLQDGQIVNDSADVKHQRVTATAEQGRR